MKPSGRPRNEPQHWTASGNRGVVVCGHLRAAEAGSEILSAGGNAVDAAAAVSAALGVCEPAGSGLGGMAIWTIHLAKTQRTFTIAGPCLAPINATPEAVAAGPRYRSYKAIALPGGVAANARALHFYGTMSEKEVLAPAIRLAEGGFPLEPGQRDILKTYKAALAKGSAGKLMLPAKPIVKNLSLAKTLRRIAHAGYDDFYTGEIGRTIVADMQSNGGYLSEADFRVVPQPWERPCMTIPFRDTTVCSVGAPGGGSALLQMLGLWERVEGDKELPGSPEWSLKVVKAIRRARTDRRVNNMWSPPDNEPETKPPFLSEEALDEAAGETSHISVFDAEGNAVSLTQSIERSFGSGEASAALGFLYNGYMKAFKIKTKKHPYFLRPGLAARSNAAPTIVVRNGEAVAAVGSTGSERLSSGVFQALARWRRQDLFSAVAAPRLHCTPEGEVLAELDRLEPGVADALRQEGYTLTDVGPYSFKMGGLQFAAKTGSEFSGAAEPRRDSGACTPT